MIAFDPDDVDVTTDPEYAARIHPPGPMNRILWAPEGPASVAKRAEMLEIDRDMNARWIVAMEKLLLEPLTDAEFTTQRMLRLKLWTRERKRLQHNLHYKYDPSRRKPRLVERDVNQMIVRMRQKLELQREQLEAVRALEPTAAPAPIVKADAPARAQAPRARPVALEPMVPAHLSPRTIELIAKDTGIRDPARATDEAILNAYAARGHGGYVAEYHLALLRDRPLPHRE